MGARRHAALMGMVSILGLLLPAVARAQISLSTAVALAEKNSPAVHAAEASVRQASAGVAEAKAAYIPNFVMGGSPGYAYGFPLGYPSLFTANSQSLAFSFSQPDYIRSANAALKGANLNLKDARQQVALDSALDYVELDHDIQEIAALDEEKDAADKLTSLEQQRVTAGVDPRTAELQAELTAAQIDEKRIHLENDADEMRQKLQHLTGLPADGLTTVATSIPAPPDNPGAAATPASNAGIAAAYANAKSKFFTAFGDSKQNFRPVVTFGAQYSLFEKFANYDQYYRNFQYNNVGIGVQITLPIFDAAKRAQARVSRAEALHAEAEADQSRDQLSEQTLAMRRTIRELAAQQKVAQIQSEIAAEQLKTVQSELIRGTGSASTPAATPIQAEQARIEERERYEDLLDSNFSLMKVELSLMRATGQITDWVHASLH